MTTPHRITLVIGNTGERSRTKVLAQAIGDALAAALPVTLQVVAAALAPRPVRLDGLVNGRNQPATAAEVAAAHGDTRPREPGGTAAAWAGAAVKK